MPPEVRKAWGDRPDMGDPKLNILCSMVPGCLYSVEEVNRSVPDCSSNRITVLLIQLKDDGLVKRVDMGRLSSGARYWLADGGEPLELSFSDDFRY